MEWRWFKIETFIPEAILERLQAALNAEGALIIDGRYDTCMAVTPVTGYWRPLASAQPFLGKTGAVSREPELKVEFRCAAGLMPAAVAAIRSVHPYEAPVINVIPLWDMPASTIPAETR